MNTFQVKSLLAALLLCRGIQSATAQDFSLAWHTLDGGGGTSTGGVYTVSGTIGQPDAGSMCGGNYSLAGGFWGFVAASGTPTLAIARTSGGVTVSWPRPANGFVLESTPTLAGSAPPWATVAFPYQTNATHIFVSVPVPMANKFYRLRRP